MEKSEIKIILSESTGAYNSDVKTQLIESLEDVKYSLNLGSGQGEVDLNLKTNYDATAYSEKQLVEIAFYNASNPTGKLQYSGFIKNINRSYSQEKGDSVDIEILGLGSILGEYEGTFSASGQLSTVLNSFIAQFHSVYNISVPMEFLGSSLLKNGITDISPVTINITGTYFDILSGIFAYVTKTWFIDKDGTIYLGDQSTVEHLLAINRDIIDLKIATSRETEIILAGNSYDISPGDKISIQNINANFNMDGDRIQKVEYGLFETKIYLGKIWDAPGSVGSSSSSSSGISSSTMGNLINGSTDKPTPVNADVFAIRSSINGLLEKVSWTNIKATLKAYFDGIYATPGNISTAVANLVNSSPAALDTLNELATALGNDPNFATTVTTAISAKEATANKNQPNGYAGLDSSGLLNPAQIPGGGGMSLLEIQIFT